MIALGAWLRDGVVRAELMMTPSRLPHVLILMRKGAILLFLT